MLRRLPVAIALVGLAACSVGESRTEALATRTSGDPVTARAPFETWVASNSDVFVGQLEHVDDQTVMTVPARMAARKMRLRISQVVKGTTLVGQTTEAYVLEPGADRITPTWVGADLLVVGDRRKFLVENGGPLAGVLVTSAASYRIAATDKGQIGIRVRSDVAGDHGYAGDFESILGRVRAGLPVRPVDAPPLSELLRRAANPNVPTDQQLGFEEMPVKPSPQSTRKGVEPQDAPP